MLDSGGEGGWEPSKWKGVLDLINKHEGEGVYDPNAPIYGDLEKQFSKPKWRSWEGENGSMFRPYFRDFPNAWTRTGVVSLEDQKFSVTPLGKQVVDGQIDPSEIFLRMMETFEGDHVRPFAALSSAFLNARRKLTLSEVYWGVVRNYRPGTDDLEQALAAEPDSSDISSTDERRLKFLLGLLVEVNAIRPVDRTAWMPWDYTALKRLSKVPNPEVQLRAGALKELCESASHCFEEHGYVFPLDLVPRVVTSLLSKRFLILTGLSGSGKTSIARAYAKWICHTPDQYVIVRVGANWTSGDVLIGYADALDTSRYQRTATLDLLLRAIAHPDEPHFLILDEMNLSHVERYFSDFLSAIETAGEAIHLYSGTESRGGVPFEIFLPNNLFILGTVNVDETTYMFSPKVLDRANVIEFRSNQQLISHFMNNPQSSDPGTFAALGAQFGYVFVSEARSAVSLHGFEGVRALLQSEIELLFKILETYDLEFGFRTVLEVARFTFFSMRIASPEPPDIPRQFQNSLDVQVLQKILPRMHGSRKKVEAPLRAVLTYCKLAHRWSEGSLSNTNELFSSAVSSSRSTAPLEPLPADENVFLSRSAKKLHRMLTRVMRDGFVNFAEA